MTAAPFTVFHLTPLHVGRIITIKSESGEVTGRLQQIAPEVESAGTYCDPGKVTLMGVVITLPSATMTYHRSMVTEVTVHLEGDRS